MKKILSVLLILSLLLTLCSCGAEPQSETPVRVITLKGPTGMGMAALMEKNENGTAGQTYDFTVCSDPTEVTPLVIKGEFDIAAVPVNLASVLLAKGADIKLAAVNTLGVLYILENGNTVNSIDDLRGKTLFAINKGATPDYILSYVLKQNGIDPEKDIDIEFVSDVSELATKLAVGKETLGLLPEPSVSSALMQAKANSNTSLRVALDMTEEWNRVCDTELAQGCIIVSASFAENSKKAYQTAMEELSDSVKEINEDAKSASELIEKFGIVPKAAVAETALPNANICFIQGAEAKSIMQNVLKVLYEANPASVGGSLPEDDFYLTGKK